MSRQPAGHRVTAAKFEQMGKAGIFSLDARFEFLEGVLYQTSPK
jgi:hypothetical protein